MLGCFAAGTAAADTVRSVTVRALDSFGTDASDVLQFCSVRAGAEFSADAASRDVRALMDRGLFTYAGYEVGPDRSNGEWDVIYVVQRRHRLRMPLAITGNRELSESKIRKLTELKAGDPIDEPILTTRVAKIRDEYMKRYFREVQVGARMVPIEGSAGFAHVTIVIEEGTRQKIRDFVFVNNPSIPASELRAAFGDYPWWNPRGWFEDTPISDLALEDARQKVLQVYRDKGFLDAKVDFPIVEKVSDKKIDMVFNVTEGDSYTVESVAVRGVTLFPEVEVQGASRLDADMLSGQKALDEAAKGIRDYYGLRGYVDTMVIPLVATVPGRPGRAQITFDVSEGQLAHIRNIVIRGNNKTKDKVIRREVLVNPGGVMNEVLIERSENRLKNLGYFRDIRHYTEQTDEAGVRDLVYEVQEADTGQFLIGAGFSSIDMLVGFVQVSQSNFDILNWPSFRGGGQRARAGLEYGMRNQSAELSWTEPWLFDRPLALTVDLYHRVLWYNRYDVTRSGGAVGISYPIIFGRVGMSYTLEMVGLSDVDSGSWSMTSTGASSTYFLDQKRDYNNNLNSVGRLYWERDARDQVFVPTRGYRAFVFGDLSEGGFGDNQFYRMGANYRHWIPIPWGKHVLSLRGRLETVDSYGDDLPIYEKLFIGGPRTIRGIKYRDGGPKVYNADGGYAPIGGKSLALLSAEYTIPIFKGVRFALFADAGSLGEDAFGGGMSDFIVSAGAGLRLDIPGFPIRFDVAKPFKRDDSYTDKEFFSFSIGFE